MKKITSIIITFLFVSCGKMQSENESNSESDKEKEETEMATTPKKDSTDASTTGELNETKGSILSESRFTKKTNETTAVESENSKPDATDITESKDSDINNKNSTPTTTATKKAVAPSNFTIKKILNGCKTGETLTQEELSKNLEIPKEAIKLVKSITKISETEMDVKWNSTWAVEKISDAKFKDGRLKVRFENNKMYTSGEAI